MLPLVQGHVGQRAFTLQKDTSTGQGTIVGAVQKVEDVVAVQNNENRDVEEKYVQTAEKVKERTLTGASTDPEFIQATIIKAEILKALY